MYGGGCVRIILKTLIIKKEKINSQTMKILSRNPTTQLGQWLLYNSKRGWSLDWILEQIQEDEDVINLVRRRIQRRGARRRRTRVRQWMDVGKMFRFGHASFLNFLRMPTALFDELIARLGHVVTCAQA